MTEITNRCKTDVSTYSRQPSQTLTVIKAQTHKREYTNLFIIRKGTESLRSVRKFIGILEDIN